jgi:hypothetical protein
LSCGLIKLEYLLNLSIDILQLELLKSLLYGDSKLLVDDIFGFNPREHVTLESFIFLCIRISKLGHRVNSDSLDEQERLLLIGQLLTFFQLVLAQLPTCVENSLKSS